LNTQTTDKFDEFVDNVGDFEEFIDNKWPLAINSAFVFYLQQLDPTQSNLLLHFYPSNSGKANQATISLLNDLKQEIENENITIVAYSADGDSAYNKMVNQIYNRVSNNFIESIDRLDEHETLFASDILHLLKRARYRLVSRELFCGFSNMSNKIDFIQYKGLLKLSNSVLSDHDNAKMKDEYATSIFQIKHALTLFNHEGYHETAYLLPFSMISAAVASENLSQTERLQLLLYSYGMFKGYSEDYESNYRKGSRILRYEKMFTNQLVRDVSVTIFTIYKLMSSCEGSISLSRMSTSPLEHYFSKIRRFSRAVHTFTNFVSLNAKIDIFNEIENIVGSISTRTQRRSFGTIVECKNNSFLIERESLINDGKNLYYMLTDNRSSFSTNKTISFIEGILEKMDSKYSRKKHISSATSISSAKGKDIKGRIIRATQSFSQ